VDKRKNIEEVEAAMQLLADNDAALEVLKGVRSAIMQRPWSLSSLPGCLRREALLFSDYVAYVLIALADSLSIK